MTLLHINNKAYIEPKIIASWKIAGNKRNNVSMSKLMRFSLFAPPSAKTPLSLSSVALPSPKYNSLPRGMASPIPFFCHDYKLAIVLPQFYVHVITCLVEPAGEPDSTPALRDRSPPATSSTMTGVEKQEEIIAPVDKVLSWCLGEICRNLLKHRYVGEPSVFHDGDLRRRSCPRVDVLMTCIVCKDPTTASSKTLVCRVDKQTVIRDCTKRPPGVD